jgi:transposase InsO family protein
MSEQTTCKQRSLFYRRHCQGETYEEIARDMGVSRECVRYWCRRQRAGKGVQSQYYRKPSGLASHFSPIVRYVLLRLRVEHPRWGVSRIRHAALQRSSLCKLCIPSPAQIGRYLHQWVRFRRKPSQRIERARPQQPERVHECWQMDFKIGIVLKNGRQVNLHTVRDPFGAACIGAVVHDAGKAGQRPGQITLEQARYTLRRCFAFWNTVPERLQTDNQTGLAAARQSNDFPTVFTLWLVGLGIKHAFIRSGHPTDNAEVERCHRTLTDYAIIGNQDLPQQQLQCVLDLAVHELNFELPSQAHGCHGKPPVEAHPELLHPSHLFHPEQELANFDLQRVYDYLAAFIWERTVSKAGRIDLGGFRYGVGSRFSGKRITIRFEPAACEFVFYDGQTSIRHHPARGLSVETLMGLGAPKSSLGPQQLLLPLPEFQAQKG